MRELKTELLVTVSRVPSVQGVETFRRKAKEQFPDGSEVVAIGHICEALRLLPNSPELLINRSLYHLIKQDFVAAVCSSFHF